MKLPQWKLESSLPPNKWQLPVEVNVARWPAGYPAIVKVVLTASTALVCTLLCLNTLWNSHTCWDSHRPKVIHSHHRKAMSTKPVVLNNLNKLAVVAFPHKCYFFVVYFPIFHNSLPHVLPPLPILLQQHQLFDISKKYDCFQRASETSRCLETSPALCSSCAGTLLRGSWG